MRNKLISPIKAKKTDYNIIYSVVSSKKEFCQHGDPDRYYFSNSLDAWNFYYTQPESTIQKFVQHKGYWHFEKTVYKRGIV